MTKTKRNLNAKGKNVQIKKDGEFVKAKVKFNTDDYNKIKEIRKELLKANVVNQQIKEEAEKKQRELEDKFEKLQRDYHQMKQELLRLRLIMNEKDKKLAYGSDTIVESPKPLLQLQSDNFTYKPPSGMFDPNAKGAEEVLQECDGIALIRTSTKRQGFSKQVQTINLVFGFKIVFLFEIGYQGSLPLEKRPVQQEHMKLCDKYEKKALYAWPSRVTRRGAAYGMYMYSYYPNGMFLCNNPGPTFDVEKYKQDLCDAQTYLMARSSESENNHGIITDIINTHFNVIPEGLPEEIKVYDNEHKNEHANDILLPLNVRDNFEREGNKTFVNFVLEKIQEHEQKKKEDLYAMHIFYHTIVRDIRKLYTPPPRFLRKFDPMLDTWQEIGCNNMTEVVARILKKPDSYQKYR